MGTNRPGVLQWRSFVTGVLCSVILLQAVQADLVVPWLMSGVERAYAAVDIIRPNDDGTIAATDDGNCGATNASCLNESVTTADTPAGTGFLTFNRNDSDYYQMSPLTGVDTVSQVDVYVYHTEGGANMQFSVELWDATEATQYGTTQSLTTRNGTFSWDTATFSGLSLSDVQLDGLRVRLLCERVSGGSPSNCDAYALYADVTFTEVIDVTVATTSSQQNLRIATTSAHVGGAFVISEDTGSRNITGITISETGSVDAANDLSNIELYYEQVADCSVASYNGTETQFGSTVAGGFSAANGTAAFTGSVTITTANDLCLYVVLDVDSTAGIGDTLEIEIADAATDLTFTGTPAVQADNTPLTLGGTTTLEDDDLRQFGFHWRNDDGSETGATSATGGTEDDAFNDFPRQQTYRLRIGVDNAGNVAADPTQFQLEYATSTGICSGATGWEDVAAASGAWDMSLSGSIADGNTSNIATAGNGALTDPGGSTFLGTGALRETTSLSGSLTLGSTNFTELEYSIEATSNANDGSTYCFRVTDSGTPISYDAYPEASIASDLLVVASSSPSQVATVAIPTTNQEVGGQFVITDSSVGSHLVSEITIHASGTVDLQNDIDNVVLFYELDTTTPFDCTGESYDGDETQFGATSTNGFSVNGTSTFSGSSFSVSPTQGACLYVKYDVAAEAADGQTLEVFFDNAAMDIVIDSGTIAPAATVDLPGFTRFSKANVVQTAYHWRDNLGTEATANSLTGGVPNTAFDEFPDTTVVRLRFGVANTGGVSATNYQYRLEWAQRTAACDDPGLTWIDVDTGGDDWVMIASQLNEAANTTNIATSTGGFADTGTFTGVLGQRESTSQTGNITIGSGNFAELEYSIEALGTIPEGSRYCFRLTDAGTELDGYTNYPEATIKLGTDFVVTRDSENITGTTLTLTEGVDYDLQFNDASRAFIRITNAHHTGGGPSAGTTGNLDAAETTVYISNPGNITTSVNLVRAAATGDTRVAWEVVEYIGDTAGENEFVVRSANTLTYGTAATQVSSGAVSGIVSDNDVVVFITGQQNPAANRFDYNAGLSTAAWNAGTDTVTLTRGEAAGQAVNTSYAVVEFTGSNWRTQRVEMNYDANYVPGFATTSPITMVNSTERAFVHAQHRAGAGEDQHADFGHQAWVSSMGNVSFILNANVQTQTLHTSVAWVIENVQTTGDRMEVTRTANAIPGSGGGLTNTNVNITKTLDDISASSLFISADASGATRSFPEPLVAAAIISDTQYNLRISDDADTINYRTAVVEWPTASRKLFQNDFRIYEDNDALLPTVPRGGVVENQEMTGDTDPVAPGESVRIRMSLRVTAAAMPAGADSFFLEYSDRPEGETCIAQGDWFRLGDTGSTTALWRGQAGSETDGTTLGTLLLSESNIAGTYEEENPSAVTPNLGLVNDVVEYDWNVEHNGAADKTDYCFRMVESDGSDLEDYDTFPLLRTVGYGPVVSRWQWFDDEGSLEPTQSLAGENVTPAAGVDDNELVKLRVSLAEQSGAEGTDVKFALQFSEYPDFATSTTVFATSTCQENSLWCYADGVGVDNDRVGTGVLSDVTCTTGTENGCGTRNEGTATTTATFDHQPLTTAEYEFTLQNAGARVNAVYYFRLYNITEAEFVPASTTNPSLVASTSRFTLASADLFPGDSSDGFTLDATSTSNTVEFGSVPFNTQYLAAQRFTFNTNATEGYQVLVQADGPLTNTYGGTIPNVVSTNAAPDGWNDACPSTQTGCFGYHTSDDTLAGGSVRFAAQDTFAALTTSPAEVFYSSVPGTEQHDMIYSLQIADDQVAGDYVTNLSHIVVPVF